jgi:hypothetical protein
MIYKNFLRDGKWHYEVASPLLDRHLSELIIKVCVFADQTLKLVSIHELYLASHLDLV